MDIMIDDSRLILVLSVLICLYGLVLLAVVADLWSGVRKAKQLGVARTSEGFRRTVKKLCGYFNALMALTAIDGVYIVLATVLDAHYGYNLPILPFITACGAVFIGFCEVKSILENAEDKERRRMAQGATLMAELLKLRNNPEDVAKEIAKILQEQHHEANVANGDDAYHVDNGGRR